MCISCHGQTQTNLVSGKQLQPCVVFCCVLHFCFAAAFLSRHMCVACSSSCINTEVHSRCVCAAPAGDYFLYMYTCRTGQIVRLTTNNDFIPLWTFPGLPMDNMCSAFSAMGSSAILPLRPEKGYAFEVAMIGGGTQGKGSKHQCWLRRTLARLFTMSLA